jgi:hypothetical protein
MLFSRSLPLLLGTEMGKRGKREEGSTDNTRQVE